MSIAIARPPLTLSRTLRVVIALARREGARLVRHPIFLVGAVLSLGLFGLMTWHNAPVLHRDDTHTPGALLPLAAATLIVANLAAIRASRDGTDELFEGLPTDRRVQVAGHLLSLFWAVLASVAVLAVMLVYLLVGDPVGTPRFGEVVSGPLTVFLFGAVGVAIATWKKHVAIAPIAVIALGAIQLMLMQPIVGIEASSARTPWFAPWVPISLTSGVPPELVIRPSGWHALYLTGLAAAVVIVALLRFGRRTPLMVALVAALVVTGTGAIGQTRPPSAQQLATIQAIVERPEDFQVCRGIMGNTYCAYRAYEPWIERWSTAIGGVLDELPPEARPEGLTIRQTFGSYFEGHVDVDRRVLRRAHRANRADIEPGYEWGRGAAEGLYEFGLLMPVVADALDLPRTKRDIRLTRADIAEFKRTLLPQVGKNRRKRFAERNFVVGKPWESCHLLGQARAVVAFWLAAQSTPATRATALKSAADVPYGLGFDDKQRYYYYLGPFSPLYWIPAGGASYSYRVSWPDAEFHYAVQLLSRDDRSVGERFRSRWEVFTDPRTPTSSALAAFDLEPHPTIKEQIADAPPGYTAIPGDSTREPEDALTGSVPCR